jgi:hypothetical protein
MFCAFAVCQGEWSLDRVIEQSPESVNSFTKCRTSRDQWVTHSESDWPNFCKRRGLVDRGRGKEHNCAGRENPQASKSGIGNRGRKEIIVPLAFLEPMSGPPQGRVSRGSAGGRIGGAKLLE